MQPLTVSVADAAKYIGIGQTKIYELINNDQITTVKIGRRRLIVVDSIREFLAAIEVRH